MRGSKTPEAQELEFRKHYLVTGNASGSARAVGLSPAMGHELATRARADEAFRKAREELRARVLPDAEQMLVAACEIALERVNDEPPSPEKLARIAVEHGLKNVSYQDPRANYFRGLSSAFAALSSHRKLDAGRPLEASGTVTITFSPTPEAAARLVDDTEPKP